MFEICNKLCTRSLTHLQVGIVVLVPKASAFWKAEGERSPQFIQAHPGNTDPHLWPHTVPVDTHEDGAEFVKEDTALVFSVSAPLGCGTPWMTRWITTLLPQTLCIKGISEQQIKQIQCWSCWHLLHGVWPHEPYGDGEPFAANSHRWKMRNQRLAGPWRAAFSGHV